jgi:hypothetical protein
MIKQLMLAILAITSCAFAGTLFSHHGAVAYDRQAMISIQGKITSYAWENPHALIRLEVEHDNGSTEEWAVETAGLVILARVGWNKETLKPGDPCTVVGYPAKNGSHTMILRNLILEDGRELTSYIP